MVSLIGCAGMISMIRKQLEIVRAAVKYGEADCSRRHKQRRRC